MVGTDKVTKLALRTCNKVFYSLDVIKHHATSSGNAPRILVVTDLYVAFYKKEEATHVMYWSNLKSTRVDKDIITLTFEVMEKNKISELPFSFQSDKAEEIKETIGEIVQRMFSADETSSMKVSKLTSKQYETNGFGLYSKYLSSTLAMKITPAKEANTFMKQIFMHGFKNIVFAKPEHLGNVFVPFIKAIKSSQITESIILPAVSHTDIFQLMIPIIQDKISLLHMLFDLKATDSFKAFLIAIKDSHYVGFTGLSFKNTEISKKEASLLAETAISKNFSSLSLMNCFKKKYISSLYDDVLTDALMSKIEMLNLDYQKELELNNIMPKMKNLKSLSLAYCDLQIKTIFEGIKQNGLNKLRLLNVSGNKCIDMPVDEGLPLSIQRIDINDVSWPAGNLTQFFTFVNSRKWEQPLKLSIANIETTSGEWDALNKLFNDAKKPPFGMINYSGNRISSEFIKMLTKCSNLTSLIINGCFGAGDNGVYEEFTNYIPKAENLSILIMKGSEQKTIGDNIKILLKKLHKSSLVQIDISNQRIGADNLGEISTLIQKNRDLQVLAFDNSGIDSLQPIQNLASGLQDIADCKRSFVLDFPTNDIESLYMKNFINDDQIVDIKRQFLALEGNNDKPEKKPKEKKKRKRSDSDDDSDYDDDDSDDESTESNHNVIENSIFGITRKETFWTTPFRVPKMQVITDFPLYLNDEIRASMEPQEKLKGKKRSNAASESEDNDSDDSDSFVPLKNKKSKKNISDSDESDSSEAKPLKRAKTKKNLSESEDSSIELKKKKSKKNLSDSDESEEVVPLKKGKSKKNISDSESEESSVDLKRKKTIKNLSDSDSDVKPLKKAKSKRNLSESESDKKSPKKKSPTKKVLSDSDSESDIKPLKNVKSKKVITDSDSDVKPLRKNKSKRVLSDSDSIKKSPKKKSPTKKPISDSDSDDLDIKRSPKKKPQKILPSDSDSDIGKKKNGKNDSPKKKGKWNFPLKSVMNVDDKMLMDDLTKKFSLRVLSEKITNES